MSYKLITFEESKQIAVDETKQDSKFVYDFEQKKIREVKSIHHLTDFDVSIIASNFYIDKSIPMWKEKTLWDYVKDRLRYIWTYQDFDAYKPYIEDAVKEYFKANTKQFSLKQLKQAIEMAKENSLKTLNHPEDGTEFVYTFDQIIQSIRPQTIEFEMEREKEKKPCRVVGDRCAYGEEYCECKRPYFIKTTTDSEGQLWCNVIKII